jgi:hypothetical protein
MEWQHDTPSQTGWWPVAICWDAAEGIFPGSGYWNGTRWVDSDGRHQPAVVRYWPERCLSEDAALSMAHEHDPESA